ncbi:Ribosomal RNA-processing protein 14 [Sphaceloma murrayae]|uniref:Ribosomal RNA-processing protein 14 n=1 Tax=Sphaceloma murrayae TaxID=2082308 RepID=A0A2K1R0B5_9PEZI|nr:Ribosomal RNA-processing protein 14 [Sphaceloma murrayae]
MDDELEARLESHAQAFEGLLSLIPAENYYAKDNSDQWQRKKQTKEEKKAARKAKLDPANRKSALDVMQENEKKRKRELGIESEGEAEISQVKDSGRGSKKAKVEPRAEAGEDQPSAAKLKAEKRKEKRERKKEKLERKKLKAEVKKVRKGEQGKQSAQKDMIEPQDGDDSGDEQNADEVALDEDIEVMDTTGLVEDNDASSVPTSPDPVSPPFDISANHSATSSSTSIIPPSDAPHVTSQIPKTGANNSKTNTPSDEPSAATERSTAPLVVNDGRESTTAPAASLSKSESRKQKAFNLPKIDQAELQARLKTRLEALRAQRKADGPDGKPVKSRQDLLEARRKKSEARKKHKKELRQQAKAEEERLNQERLQGSGSPLSTDIFSPRTENNSFSFGRVAFEDGATADATLEGVRDVKKRKGPQDIKTALQAAEKKQQRINNYDEDKRKEIEDKDAWLNAKKRVYGEKVKDDTSLLKKALKRKEKAKGKSEKEWTERQDGVKKGQEMRQKKREDNLAKRRDEKGSKGKKGPKPKPKGKGKPKGRPGFEGKF